MRHRIIGHNTIRSRLAETIAANRLAHAILLCGEAGIGKELVAREAAGQLLCQSESPTPPGGCGTCRSCSLLTSGNHPDLLFLTASSGSGATDNIRSLLSSLALAPYLGGARVVLITDIELLPGAAGNSLLKSLEEPRPKTFFLLTTAHRSRVLQTIRSRTQSWGVSPLASEEIAQILTSRGLPADVAPLAHGSMARALALIEQREDLDRLRGAVGAAIKGELLPWVEVVRQYSTTRDKLLAIIPLLPLVAREQLTVAGEELTRRRAAAFLSGSITAQMLLEERHLNATAVMASLSATLTAPADDLGLTFGYPTVPHVI